MLCVGLEVHYSLWTFTAGQDHQFGSLLPTADKTQARSREKTVGIDHRKGMVFHYDNSRPHTSLSTQQASATSATADGLAPAGASQTKKVCLQVIKKRPRKKFCLQVIKKRPRKPDVADVHEWCSAATD
ncbi:hypothetical protein EVAR_78756_1 [Eumeta japonica]|uniref:Histone-lysine N-methyltransferase SETMAR n=1 Tax=Eumeta variegata TaxID=151549 RepID=A0A4C1T1D2_EUMVA|nr:hypothetical protein EVAR_78756_1 [Eumeta japonica]